MKGFRKELEKIFNIPVVKAKLRKTKNDLADEIKEHEITRRDKEFCEINYKNETEKFIELEKKYKFEKELHNVTKINLQQAHEIIKNMKEGK